MINNIHQEYDYLKFITTSKVSDDYHMFCVPGTLAIDDKGCVRIKADNGEWILYGERYTRKRR